MKINILLVITILILTGCTIHTAPKNDIKYSENMELKELAGTYKNAGDPDGYLSRIIFTPADMKHSGFTDENIRFIDVSVLGNKVIVKAISQDCKSFQKEFLMNRDFEITNGKIVLNQKFSLLTRGGDDPLVGPSYEKAIITLDQSGHGIYKNEGHFAGLAFLLVPMAITATSEVKFERLTNMQISTECNMTNQ